jgi:hypothetical protein
MTSMFIIQMSLPVLDFCDMVATPTRNLVLRGAQAPLPKRHETMCQSASLDVALDAEQCMPAA